MDNNKFVTVPVDDLANAAPSVDAKQTQVTAPDPVVEANREMLLQRSIIGVKKYGLTLDNSSLSQQAFLKHALEETLDLANYLQAAIRKGAVPASTAQPDSEREVQRKLAVALERMDRARAILTGGNPRPDCNWGMLDTADLRTASSEAAAPQERDAVLEEVAQSFEKFFSSRDELAARYVIDSIRAMKITTAQPAEKPYVSPYDSNAEDFGDSGRGTHNIKP